MGQENDLEATPAGPRLCLTFSSRRRQGCIKRCTAGKFILTSPLKELVSDPTSSQFESIPFQSKSAQGLRGSLRNLTWRLSSPAASVSRHPRLFRKRVFSDTSEHSTFKDDWSEDFHLITPDDLGLSPPSSVSGPITVDISQPTSTPLSPLVIPDNAANRISNYTSESPTPTLTEFAHLTSSFPLPPSHIPIDPNTFIDPRKCSIFRIGGRIYS